jgi:hypothetical protein
MRKINLSNPPEVEEQKRLAAYLDHRFGPYGWLHIPNEIATSVPDGRRFGMIKKLKACGVKKGAPDVLIFQPIPTAVGVAIELKRKKGGRVTPEQKQWATALAKNGWYCAVANGANAAIQLVEELYAE